MLFKKPKLKEAEKSQLDPWPIRDKFLQNLFDSISFPIWLLYLDDKGRALEDSKIQYEGGRIVMPNVGWRWKKATHVGVVIEGKIQSKFRITSELPVMDWQYKADELLMRLKGKIARSVVSAALGKFKNSFF